MKHPGIKRTVALFVAFVFALQGILPDAALAERRTVEVENHTLATEQNKVAHGIVIDGVDRPTAGSELDASANVTTAGGDAWEIPVIWVRDDLKVGNNIAANGHMYLPVLAFFTPQGYTLEGTAVTVTLSDSLTTLFGTNEIISVYNATTGITYILPASLRDLFASVPTRAEDASATNAPAAALELSDDQPEAGDTDSSPIPHADSDPVALPTLVEIHCAQTAREALSDEELEWFIDLIANYLEPQAVELLLQSFPAFRQAANNGEIGKRISLYIYYESGDKDGKLEHEIASEALAYVLGSVAKKDNEVVYCYMLGVDVEDLIKRDSDDEPIVDPKTGRYVLIRDGENMETLKNTIVHELFHALMDDYNRTGMSGSTRLQDLMPSQGGVITEAQISRHKTLRYPGWFVEGTASAVENNYQYRYKMFQILRRQVGSNGYVGTGLLEDSFTQELILYNYLNAQKEDGGLAYFALPWSVGGVDQSGKSVDSTASRYASGYLATLYLGELAARYSRSGEPSVRTIGGVTTVDSYILRDGLNSILTWLHDDNTTLDSLIKAISPKDATGRPIYTDTKSFEEQFICGPKLPGNDFATGSDSLVFVTDFLNYMLALDNQLPADEHPNGSILFDFDRRFTSPLDSSKEAHSDYLRIVGSNLLMPSSVKPTTAQIGGGKSDPDEAANSTQQQNASLPVAAKSAQVPTKNVAGVRAADATRATDSAQAADATQATDSAQDADATRAADATQATDATQVEPQAKSVPVPAVEPVTAAEPAQQADAGTTSADEAMAQVPASEQKASQPSSGGACS